MPLHVESVAWAPERKDTLSTFFGLLSLIAYMRYGETHLTAPSLREMVTALLPFRGEKGEAPRAKQPLSPLRFTPLRFTPLPFRTIRHLFYPRNPWF